MSSAGITIDIGGPDTVAPNGLVSGLVNNQTLPFGPITFGGTATDNVGLADVQVGIQNRTTLRWWKATTGTWVTSFTWNSGSTLSMPGGSPTVMVVRLDAAGRRELHVDGARDRRRRELRRVTSVDQLRRRLTTPVATLPHAR